MKHREHAGRAPAPADEGARQRLLHTYDVLDTEPEASLDELTRLAARLCGTSMAVISLLDGERLWFKSREGLDLKEVERGHSFCAHLVSREGSLVVPDAALDERFRASPFVTEDLRVRFYAGAPLVGPDGIVLGALCVFDPAPRTPSVEQIHTLEVLARQVMQHLEGRRLDKAQARLTEALRTSQERFDSLQHVLHEAYFEWNPQTGQVVWSPRLMALLGNTPEGAGGWFELVHPEERGRVAQSFQQAITTRTPLWTEEYRIRRGDGVYLPIISRSLFMFDPAGLPVRLVGVLEDCSEREEWRARLEQSDRMASVGTLAAGVAHELNNPLAYVIANLDFAREELRLALEPTGSPALPPGDVTLAPSAPQALTQALTQALDEAREGAERMRIIVRDLKLFSRRDDDRLEWVRLPRVLDSAAAMAWNEIRHRARLVKDYQPLPAVYANESRLGQVFLNLLVNAAHAIQEGAAESNEIRLSTRQDAEGQVLIEVRDSGQGIPEALRPRIFEPFFTTKPLGVGTGLGLPICHDIVTRLGGRLEFESELGVGTVFRVVLPPPGPEGQGDGDDLADVG